MGSVGGVVLGAFCIVAVPELLRDVLGSSFADARYLIFGISLILMAIYRPQGLWPSRRRTLELRPTDPDEVLQDTLYDMERRN
jgi:branched-chain amino acid transport system permease protein